MFWFCFFKAYNILTGRNTRMFIYTQFILINNEWRNDSSTILKLSLNGILIKFECDNEIAYAAKTISCKRTERKRELLSHSKIEYKHNSINKSYRIGEEQELE